MGTITIRKKEYKELLDKKLKYEYLRQILEEDIFAPPPTRKVKSVLLAFKTTRRYSPQFLKSLGRALKRSAYFK